MKAESVLFAGVALFFAATASVYAAYSRDPAGIAALLVSFAMAALISFFFAVQYRRRGRRLQDTKDAEVREAAGPLAFFPPRSYHPVLTAAGTAVLGLGVVYGLWLFLVGVGVLAPGVLGFVFQYEGRRQT